MAEEPIIPLDIRQDCIRLWTDLGEYPDLLRHVITAVTIRSTERGMFLEVYVEGASATDKPTMRYTGFGRGELQG